MVDNKCYICFEETKPLVRPCTNTICTYRAHPSCIGEQYKSLKKCGACGSSIIKRTQFNKFKCFNFCHKLLVSLLSCMAFLLGSPIIIVLSLGKSPIDIKSCSDNQFEAGEVGCENKAVFNIIVSLILSIPFLFHFVDSLFCQESQFVKDNNNKHGFHMMMLRLFIAPIIYILLCHGIGHLTIKYILGIDEFFTWRTSLIGYIYTIIMIFINLIRSPVYKFYLLVLNELSDPEFGDMIEK